MRTRKHCDLARSTAEQLGIELVRRKNAVCRNFSVGSFLFHELKHENVTSICEPAILT